MTTPKNDITALTAQRRLAAASLVESLSPADLQTPSLVGGWTVKDVLAHLVDGARPSLPRFAWAAVRHGGTAGANTALAHRGAQRPTADLVSDLRTAATSTFAPPRVGPRGPLTDVLVHTGDMTVPLGLPHDPPHGAVRLGLEFVTTGVTSGFVARGRLSGLSLDANDLGLTVGAGAPVTGRGIDLLMAACGRPLLDQLSGEGVELLRARL